MSEFLLEEATKSGFVKGFINDATFLYTNIQEPREKFSKDGKEFSVKLVVDKATAKAFKKKFSKQGFQEIETENFEEQYGIAPPYPGEDVQYLITLKAPDDKIMRSVDPSGEEVEKSIKLDYNEFKRPKVYVPASEGVKDITKDLGVGNGSVGHASFWVLATSTYGDFARLSAILVNDLIVYDKRSNNQSAFGTVINSTNESEQHFGGQEKEEEPSAGSRIAPY